MVPAMAGFRKRSRAAVQSTVLSNYLDVEIYPVPSTSNQTEVAMPASTVSYQSGRRVVRRRARPALDGAYDSALSELAPELG